MGRDAIFPLPDGQIVLYSRARRHYAGPRLPEHVVAKEGREEIPDGGFTAQSEAL